MLAALAVPADPHGMDHPAHPGAGRGETHARHRHPAFQAPRRPLGATCRLRRASFGVAFFWGFAAFINLWSVKLAKALTDGQEGFGTLSSWFMAAASLGMAAGFGVASFLLRKRIELGWVPLAGVAMTLTALGSR